MSEPAPIWETASPEMELNETAVDIVAEVLGHRRETVADAIGQAHLGIRHLPGTINSQAWLAYRAAVAGLSHSEVTEPAKTPRNCREL